MTTYIDALHREIESTAALHPELRVQPLETVYFGGGTPSLVPPALLETLLLRIDDLFGIRHDAEVTLEADPGTFDDALLRTYKSLGINRLSVGVQSFDDELLSRCGRSHGSAEIVAALDAIDRVGFPSWNLDLMAGLPGLTEPVWDSTLAKAVAAQPDHIAVYDLQVEPGTPFARLYSPGVSPLPSEDAAADMLRRASEFLSSHGLVHYEVSNYAKPGHQSRHNTLYWTDAAFWGFGLGSASYIKGRRFSRPKKIGEYLRWAEAGALGGGDPATPRDRLLETIMLRARLLQDGVPLDILRDIMGSATHEPRLLASIESYTRDGKVWMTLDGAGRPQRFGLTDPEGLLISNTILSDIFAALDPA